MTEALSPLSTQRWRRLVPIAFITYSFAYLDRSNYSIAAAGGLEDKLQITSSQSGLLGGLFFIGYFLFQVPAGTFAERRGVKSLMFWSLLAWGVLAALQGAVTTYWLLLVVRFLLGVVEAVVLPAMLVFLSHWFSKAERGRADTFLILGNPVTLMWMSVVSGYIVEAVGYQWMFVIEGLPAIAWAIIFRILVEDRPRDAAWLTDQEGDAVESRLADEQRSLPPAHGLRQVMTSWNAIVLSAQYLLWSIGVYGLVFWLPSIIRQLTDRGIGSAGALSAVPYAAAVVLMIVASTASDRLRVRTPFIWPFLLLAAGCFLGSYFANGGSFLISFILLIVAAGAMYAPYGPYFANIPELFAAADAAPATGMVNAFGGLGGFLGTYIVGVLGGADSAVPFVFLSASLLGAALLMFAVRRPRTNAEDASNKAGEQSSPAGPATGRFGHA